MGCLAPWHSVRFRQVNFRSSIHLGQIGILLFTGHVLDGEAHLIPVVAHRFDGVVLAMGAFGAYLKQQFRHSYRMPIPLDAFKKDKSTGSEHFA